MLSGLMKNTVMLRGKDLLALEIYRCLLVWEYRAEVKLFENILL